MRLVMKLASTSWGCTSATSYSLFAQATMTKVVRSAKALRLIMVVTNKANPQASMLSGYPRTIGLASAKHDACKSNSVYPISISLVIYGLISTTCPSSTLVGIYRVFS